MDNPPAQPQFPANPVGTLVITNLYQACYGSPPVGTKVFIRVNQNLDGWQDLPKETSAIVPPAAFPVEPTAAAPANTR